MALQAIDGIISEEDYLIGELESEIKHEYIDGQVYAMAGVSRNHSILANTISMEFGIHLKGKPCNTHQSDFKVKVGTKYFYPDIVVECEKGGDDYYTESPVIIVEVISPSTRIRDEITKLRAYQIIPSLIEYVLVSQDIVRVMVLKRISGDIWGNKIYALGDSIFFESIGLTLSVEEIYDRVDNEDMQEYLKKKGEEQYWVDGVRA
ncbi:MAG: Uma2 family endonuclease [Magnetococcales bacterium]|nr:Uma2 family endonuclease [Magnetococcales bacterium]